MYREGASHPSAFASSPLLLFSFTFNLLSLLLIPSLPCQSSPFSFSTHPFPGNFPSPHVFLVHLCQSFLSTPPLFSISTPPLISPPTPSYYSLFAQKICKTCKERIPSLPVIFILFPRSPLPPLRTQLLSLFNSSSIPGRPSLSLMWLSHWPLRPASSWGCSEAGPHLDPLLTVTRVKAAGKCFVD